MKTLKVILLLSVILLGFKPAKADPPTLSAALNNVTKAYLKIKNALITSNASTVQSKALDLIAALNAVPDAGMTAEQHAVWFDYLNKLEFDSRHMSESGAIDHQREHFSSLSDNLYTVLKTFRLNTSTLYRQYSSKTKTYWISETAAIKNPYFGNGPMLNDGGIKEVLKAK